MGIQSGLAFRNDNALGKEKEREGREVEKEEEDGLSDATHQWKSLGEAPRVKTGLHNCKSGAPKGTLRELYTLYTLKALFHL